MKDVLPNRRYTRLRNLVIFAAIVLGYLVITIGLALLLFFLGEKETYPLGANLEHLTLQIELYHIEEVTEGGDYAFLINGSYHYYRIIPISERFSHALSSFFSLRWSVATSQRNLPLASVFATGLKGTLLGLLSPILGSFLAFPCRYLKFEKIGKVFYPVLIVLLIALIVLSVFFARAIWLSSLLVGLAAFTGMSRFALEKDSLYDYLTKGFLVIGLCWLCFHFVGFFSSSEDPMYCLSSLLRPAFSSGDNHTYALVLFFLLVLSAIPFVIGFGLMSRRKRDDIEAIPVE